MTTTTGYTKPLPNIHDPNNAPFWQAVRRHEVSCQRCPSCSVVRYPAAKHCPECLAENNEWVTLSGRGKVWSFGVYYHLFVKSFAEDIPYNVALVELEEGPRLITSIVGIPNEKIEMEMPVEAVFETVTDEVTLIKFRPRSE